MARKPSATLKTTSKSLEKELDSELSEREIAAKSDFTTNHVAQAKPLLAEAVIAHFGGWSMFSLYAHDANECGVDAGFRGFSKDSDCKAFFLEHKKLLKDFYKTKTGKAKEKEQADLLDAPTPIMENSFTQDQIDAVFSSKAKTADTESADEDEGDIATSDKEIMVWLARNSAQHMVGCYAQLHQDRFAPDPIIESIDADEGDDPDDTLDEDESNEADNNIADDYDEDDVLID